MALRWGSITLDGPSPEVRVEASLKRVKGKGLVRGTPKTDAAYRSIPLGDIHVQVLHEHRRRQNEIRSQAGPLWEDNDLVFCTSHGVHPISFGRALDARSVRRRWERLLRRSDLQGIRFHGLRHTAFTHMAAAEVNPETIRQLAGHSDVRVTLSVYTHPTAAMKRNAIGELGRLYAMAERDDIGRAEERASSEDGGGGM